MVIDRKRIEELKKEGFAQGAEEIKEKYIESGNRDGRIEALQDMLVESMKYQFNEVDKNINQKIRYIKNKLFLREMIQLSYETKNIEVINSSIHDHLSDEDMYRREGYEYAINHPNGFYQSGRFKGLINEKLSMIFSIFKKRFGHLEIEIEAAIMTMDLDERIEDLFLMTFKLYDKKELVRYLKKTMTGANVIKAGAFLVVYKSVRLNYLIDILFETKDCSIQEKIEKVRDLGEINFLIEKAKYSECLEDFIKELDQAVERAVDHRHEFSLDHLLQE
ncbi:hypothetical protein Dthio_PD0113 [Desulfonatronospira thiodismutans ASO3-1]|uniref:Uncharacterized protein n=2 Tax=Desulfonatronospira thiodismutans TaxID=488939 RepID=D6SV55_9BACT|nr:hypothetical protein Dthio_PD0113 [Desulfonatronospira thiodismutans ASO3-1]